jgi:hypothetical protein
MRKMGLSCLLNNGGRIVKSARKSAGEVEIGGSLSLSGQGKPKKSFFAI